MWTCDGPAGYLAIPQLHYAPIGTPIIVTLASIAGPQTRWLLTRAARLPKCRPRPDAGPNRPPTATRNSDRRLTLSAICSWLAGVSRTC